jgi:hypothetical protein
VPRIDIAAQDLIGSYPSLPLTADSADLVETAADATEKQETSISGREIIVAHNTGVGARTVTFTSVAHLGRTGDITAYSIGAGEIAVFGPFKAVGWRQSNGKLYYEASHADVKFAVIAIPTSL